MLNGIFQLVNLEKKYRQLSIRFYIEATKILKINIKLQSMKINMLEYMFLIDSGLLYLQSKLRSKIMAIII